MLKTVLVCPEYKSFLNRNYGIDEFFHGVGDGFDHGIDEGNGDGTGDVYTTEHPAGLNKILGYGDGNLYGDTNGEGGYGRRWIDLC